MEHLRGYTSGLGIPYYIVNAPGGLGKTPMLPNYIVSRESKSITIRTWENNIIEYPNKPTVPFKELIESRQKIDMNYKKPLK